MARERSDSIDTNPFPEDAPPSFTGSSLALPQPLLDPTVLPFNLRQQAHFEVGEPISYHIPHPHLLNQNLVPHAGYPIHHFGHNIPGFGMAPIGPPDGRSDFNPYRSPIPPNPNMMPLEFPATMGGQGFDNASLMNNFQRGQAFHNMPTPSPGFNGPANIMPGYAGPQQMMLSYPSQTPVHNQMPGMFAPSNPGFNQHPSLFYNQGMMANNQPPPSFMATTNALLGKYSFDINSTPPFVDEARGYFPNERAVLKIAGVSSKFSPVVCVKPRRGKKLTCVHLAKWFLAQSLKACYADSIQSHNS